MIKANKSTKSPKKAKGAAANSSSAHAGKKMSKKPVKLSAGSKKMSPKDRFKMMMENKKKKGGKTEKASYGKKGTKKMSITAKKPKKATGKKTKLSGTFASKAITPKKAKVVKHKKKGRI